MRKVFVGGLKENHDEETLTEHFSAFGNVIGVKIISDRATGRKRGFGYVEFDDYDAVDKAVYTQPHTIKYVVVDVKKSVYKKNQEQPNDQNQDQSQNPQGPYWNNWGPGGGPPPNWGPNYNQPPPNWGTNNFNQPPPNWNWGPQPYWGWQQPNWGPPPNCGWTWNPQSGWVQTPPQASTTNPSDDKGTTESQASYNSTPYNNANPGTASSGYNSGSNNYPSSPGSFLGTSSYGNNSPSSYPAPGAPPSYTSGGITQPNSQKPGMTPSNPPNYGSNFGGYNQNWNAGSGPIKSNYQNNRTNPYSKYNFYCFVTLHVHLSSLSGSSINLPECDDFLKLLLSRAMFVCASYPPKLLDTYWSRTTSSREFIVVDLISLSPQGRCGEIMSQLSFVVRFPFIITARVFSVVSC